MKNQDRLLTQVKVVHAVGHQYVIEDSDVCVIFTAEEVVCAIRACHILLWKRATILHRLQTRFIRWHTNGSHKYSKIMLTEMEEVCVKIAQFGCMTDLHCFINIIAGLQCFINI